MRMVSTSIVTSISVLRIWCDGSDGLLEFRYEKTNTIHMRKRPPWVAVVGGERSYAWRGVIPMSSRVHEQRENEEER